MLLISSQCMLEVISDHIRLGGEEENGVEQVWHHFVTGHARGSRWSSKAWSGRGERGGAVSFPIWTG